VEPQRVKVRGDLYHGKIPEGAVYVGRAAPGLPASIYANPFKVNEKIDRDHNLWPYIAEVVPGGTRGLAAVSFVRAEQVVDAYSRWFFDVPALLLNAAEMLGGRDLACWCKIPPPGEPDHCHAAWLVGMAAGLTEGEKNDG
jgi:hypothetical protein